MLKNILISKYKFFEKCDIEEFLDEMWIFCPSVNYHTIFSSALFINMKTLILTLLNFIQLGMALDFFVMRKYTEISTDFGTSVVLNCSSNIRYEYCTWIHQLDFCEMEFNSSKNLVKFINCTFHNRMKLIGNHSNNECAIELQNVSGKDAGVWKCIMEEYKFGYVNGNKDTGEIHLVVKGIPPKGAKKV